MRFTAAAVEGIETRGNYLLLLLTEKDETRAEIARETLDSIADVG